MAEFAPEALEIVRVFEAERSQGWPTESRLAAPTITLASQATAWLKLGAPVALIIEVMCRQFAKLRAKSNSRAPTDLQFCGMTMETETMKFLTAGSGSGLTGFGSARGVDEGSARVDPAEAQRRARIDGFRQNGFWLDEWGPEPVRADDGGYGS